MPLILPILNSLMPINLLSIGPSFVPTPYNINWYNLRQDVENFVNKICFTFQNFIQSSTEPSIYNDEQQLEDPQWKTVVKTANFRVKATNSHYLEAFIEKIEQSIFHRKNVNTKVFHNITKKEEKLLRKLKLGKIIV